MNCKLVSYDLCKPGCNYEGLINAIKSFGTWAHITESNWIVQTAMKTTEIRDYLLKHLDSNDRLFVGKLSDEAAWKNLLCKNEWIQSNL